MKLFMRTFLISILVITNVITCFAHQPAWPIEGVVSQVFDGDSIEITGSSGKKLKIRLYGIDAPQAGSMDLITGLPIKKGQPFWDAALQALRGKLAGHRVRVELMDSGKQKKLLAIVWLDKRNINHEMLVEGWAWAHRKRLDERHRSEYMRLEEVAKAKRLGLWQQSNPQPPWEFRRLEKMRELLFSW